MKDLDFMREACAEALAAYHAGEYPVGAVVVRRDQIVSRGRNTTDAERDPTAHAEIRAVREACRKLDRLKLADCTLYTTLFPCPMCEAVVTEVSIQRVVYGGRSFRWIREVKYESGTLEWVGPIANHDCRGLFEKRLRERGRDDILRYEST